MKRFFLLPLLALPFCALAQDCELNAEISKLDKAKKHPTALSFDVKDCAGGPKLRSVSVVMTPKGKKTDPIDHFLFEHLPQQRELRLRYPAKADAADRTYLLYTYTSTEEFLGAARYFHDALSADPTLAKKIKFRVVAVSYTE